MFSEYYILNKTMKEKGVVPLFGFQFYPGALIHKKTYPVPHGANPGIAKVAPVQSQATGGGSSQRCRCGGQRPTTSEGSFAFETRLFSFIPFGWTEIVGYDFGKFTKKMGKVGCFFQLDDFQS